MVKRIAAFFYACILTIKFLDAAPVVEASLDSTDNQAHFPLQGTITITHSKEETIDPRSFMIDGKPLDASFVKDVLMTVSSDTFVSIYHFQLPGQEKGLYVLPAITMKIEGQSYQTSPSTYEVKEEEASQPAASSSADLSKPLIFRLEASVQGPKTLYPGERTKFVYRISYNRSIDLTRSELPMIHPSHFQKIGDVHIRDSQLPDVTVQDLTQEVEASELGSFTFGPSFIEGYSYAMEAGQKVYDSKLLKANAPLVTVEVKPFPQPAQPASFTGALGQIGIENHLTSSNAVLVGDTMQLQVKIQGIANLTDLHLPPLQCQPGFSGFFQMSDNPPLAKVKEQTKIFEVELRPLTSLVKQIPSIEVSSFDLTSKKYIIQHTAPIPITVSVKTEESPSLSSIPLFVHVSPAQWPSPLLPPLELKEGQLKPAQAGISWLNSDRVFWLLPIGLLLLFLQIAWKKSMERFPKPQPPKSEILFEQALKTKNLQLLEESFWNRLFEKRKIPEGFKQFDALSLDKHLGPIPSFIFQLQAWQYGLDKNFDFKQIKRDAKQLFDSI